MTRTTTHTKSGNTRSLASNDTAYLSSSDTGMIIHTSTSRSVSTTASILTLLPATDLVYCPTASVFPVLSTSRFQWWMCQTHLWTAYLSILGHTTAHTITGYNSGTTHPWNWKHLTLCFTHFPWCYPLTCISHLTLSRGGPGSHSLASMERVNLYWRSLPQIFHRRPTPYQPHGHPLDACCLPVSLLPTTTIATDMPSCRLD